MRHPLIPLAIGAVLFALACGGATPLSPAQQDYAGSWVASDGTSVQIFLDGGGSYHGSNTNIDGGTTTITADTVTIGFGPLSKSMHLDAPPTDNGGVWSMKLDGVDYTKQ
jgi:hypothetical protein